MTATHVWNTHPESGLTPEDLRVKYLDEPGHPQFIMGDWRYEVANEDTKLGYWEWVMHKVEAWEEGD